MFTQIRFDIFSISNTNKYNINKKSTKNSMFTSRSNMIIYLLNPVIIIFISKKLVN